MILAIALFIIASLLEIILNIGFLWHYKKYLAGLLILLLSISTGLIFGYHISWFSAILVILTVYRIINLLRLIEARINKNYLAITFRKTSFWLMLFQSILAIVWLLVIDIKINRNIILLISSTLILVCSMVIAIFISSNLQKIQVKAHLKNMPSSKLPSLSVLIPARNETESLNDCLASLVSSTYPKLEIIVLDDCSQNKHTPEIIKDYAHAGVRFIAGQATPDNWLAKNYAFEQLSEQASGEILLFCGVDVRFSENSLTQIVEILLSNNKVMLSLLPNNLIQNQQELSKLITQPFRYGWELIRSRDSQRKPPVLSTCWCIKANELSKSGGFKAVTKTIIPERYFAKLANSKNNGYLFFKMLGDQNITSLKAFDEQKATAIRTKYPELHKRIELVASLSIIQTAIFIMPVYLLILGIINSLYIVGLLSFITLIINLLSYLTLSKLTFNRFIIQAIVYWPVAIIFDIILVNQSMWQYEFRQVIWKGRNICIPIMKSV